MSDEKIVYIHEIKNIISESLVFLFYNLFYIKQSVVVSMSVLATLLTLVHNSNTFPLQFMLLISNKIPCKNNLEVNF